MPSKLFTIFQFLDKSTPIAFYVAVSTFLIEKPMFPVGLFGFGGARVSALKKEVIRE